MSSAQHTELRSSVPQHDYTMYPREFASYRWYKPLLVGVLTVALSIIFQVLIAAAALFWAHAEGVDIPLNGLVYDIIDTTTGPSALISLGSIAVILLAIALALAIVRDRPWSSLSSSRGGWNWSAFLKCMVLAVIVYGVSLAVQVILVPDSFAPNGWMFTAVGLVLTLVLCPLQCIAEEYAFRGLIMQAIGCWTKIPIMAVVVQALLFASMHAYDIVGVVAVFASGLCMGVIAWLTRGLEASSAIHIVNNMTSFLLLGFGFGTVASTVDIPSAVITIVFDIVYVIAVIAIGRKFAWFVPRGA